MSLIGKKVVCDSYVGADYSHSKCKGIILDRYESRGNDYYILQSGEEIVHAQCAYVIKVID